MRKWEFRTFFRGGANVWKDQAVRVLAIYVIYLPSARTHTELVNVLSCC